ncbi:MAG: hypothetical protein NZ749_10805, partial [bacterium]|nr:hypothetical protein [bacterium]
EVHGLLPFAQSLFQQAGVKTTAPKKWSGIYFGVPAVFTELHTSDGEVCFQLVLATIDKWTLPLRMVVVPSAEDLYVRDTLSVRRQLIPSELFSVPREYKLVR